MFAFVFASTVHIYSTAREGFLYVYKPGGKNCAVIHGKVQRAQ
jgi:hypothetical protein